jgi:hypothetical protein
MAAAIVAWAVTTGCALSGPAGRSLDTLPNRSGWLLLGALTESGAWATAPKHLLVADGTDSVPKPRDLIRVTAEQDVLILDFAQTKDSRYLEPPANRPLSAADRTGVVLQPNTVVRVQRVFEEKPSGIRGVWVLIRAEGDGGAR